MSCELLSSFGINRFGGVIVSVVDRGFEPRSGNNQRR